MTRYSLALATLLTTTPLTTADPWSYLSVDIPTPLSDMAVSSMTLTANNSTEQKIILTGGCVSEKGNEFLGDYYACLEITDKAYTFEPIAPKTQFQAWTGTFTALPNMPRERNRHASVQINDKLCVIGGRDGSDTLLGPIDCYDFDSETWTEVGSIPEEYQTSDFAAYVDGTTVHMIGGYNAIYEALSQVTLMDMEDLENITFEEGVPIDTPRGDISAVEAGENKILISGGFTHLNDFSTPLFSVEQFDLESGTWGPVDALNEERGDKQLVNLNDKIYAIGGEGRVDATGPVVDKEVFFIAAGQGSIVLDTVEVLDLTTDGDVEWMTHGDLPASLFRFAASGWKGDGEEDGVIFVFGGQVGFEAECECFRTTEKVLVFDPSQSEAVRQSAEPSGGVAFSAVVGHVVAVVGIVTMMLA